MLAFFHNKTLFKNVHKICCCVLLIWTNHECNNYKLRIRVDTVKLISENKAVQLHKPAF